MTEDLPAARADWSTLAERSRNVFATPEWADAWRERLAPGAEARLLVCRGADGAARAIWPLHRQARGPLGVLRLLGHGPADELGPACAPEDRPLAAAGLRRALREGALGGQALLADRFASDAPWPDLLDARILNRESSPVLPTAGRAWEDYLAGQSRNFREQAGRRRRKLEREHAVEIALTEDPARLDADFDTLVGLHGARWSDGESEAFAGAQDAFHRDFAARALERGWLRLWVMRVDGQAVAAWHGFRFGGVDAFYQSGRDPEWDRASVGFVLMAHTVRLAFEDGMDEYRFLRGDESYKSRWAAEDRPVDVLLAPASRAGRPAVAAAARLARSPRVRALRRRALM